VTGVRSMAPAKINLGLEIIRRRPDGFHNIVTIFQTIDLQDTIRVSPDHHLGLRVDDRRLQGESNLALRAAKTLQERFSIAKGVKIQLDKEIPLAAGLGGASSDAAATLRALSLLWEIEPTTAELHEVASSLGSDVPFFLTGGTVLGRGRGEIVQPLSKQVSTWVVLVVPNLVLQNKTATMFGMLHKSDFTSGGTVLALSERIEAGESIIGVELPNTFSRHAFKVWPILDALSEEFRSAGARGVSLSGAGPSLFTLVEDQADATFMRDRMMNRVSSKARVFVCKTTSHTSPPVRDNR
jgi:4-diphosphocytidyl-2-C-methyl-D-erythritol kinase